MGNGILHSFSSDCSFTPEDSPILNDSIKNLTPLLVADDDLRGVFVNYVSNGEWIEEFLAQGRYAPALTAFEQYSMQKDNNQALSHLRYQLPSGELFPTTSHAATNKVVDAVAAAEDAQRNFLVRQLTKRRRSVLAMTRASLTPENLQSFVCAVLMRLFTRSADFRDWYTSNEKYLLPNEHLAQLVDFKMHPAGGIKSILRKSMQAVLMTVSTMTLSTQQSAEIEIDIDRQLQFDPDDFQQVLSDEDEGESHAAGQLPDTAVVAEKSCRSPSVRARAYATDSRRTATSVGDRDLCRDQSAKSTRSAKKASLSQSFYESLLVQTVAKMDVLALSDTLSTDLWLREVLRFLDTLPVAITISDAHRRSTGDTFPLIYVNRAFEKLTGYHRQDVLGRNCRFLQTEERTEMRQVELLQAALRDGQSTKLALTNVRKDGTSFLNFLALRPVVNREQQYAFVVGILYDISQAKCVAQSEAAVEQEGAQLLGAGHWWHSHQDEHDRLVEDLEGIDALLRLLPMLLV